MNLIYELKQVPYLKSSLLFYLLLGGTDTLHHLHAALVLGHSDAWHAVFLGVILTPIAVAAVIHFLRSGATYSAGLFLLISAAAIALPGFYHGGWVHFTKLLAYLRVDSVATDIGSLFPRNNGHFWFYEISGLLEFGLAVIASYFSYNLMTSLVTDGAPR